MKATVVLKITLEADCSASADVLIGNILGVLRHAGHWRGLANVTAVLPLEKHYEETETPPLTE